MFDHPDTVSKFLASISAIPNLSSEFAPHDSWALFPVGEERVWTIQTTGQKRNSAMPKQETVWTEKKQRSVRMEGPRKDGKQRGGRKIKNNARVRQRITVGPMPSNEPASQLSSPAPLSKIIPN